MKTKILIFGAGCCGREYLESLHNSEMDDEFNVVGFLDNDLEKTGEIFVGVICHHPEKVVALEYDLIVIAHNTSDRTRNQMHAQLLRLGVPERKIRFFPDKNKILESTFEYQRRLEFFWTFAEYVGKQRITGSLAECGVFTGDTAKRINEYFPDRKLYLFDTFEGFTQKDIEMERVLADSRFINGEFNNVGLFSQTSVDVVMSGMLYPENIIIKKGWVPETFAGLEDQFCFVHLDMDLYQPMLAALQFFWNKMSKGGVIVCHDYFYTSQLPGVEKAVADFEKWLGKTVAKLPLHPTVGLALVRN